MPSSSHREPQSLKRITDADIREYLQFSPSWFESRIITEEYLAELVEALRTEDDPHAEHWRWRAFKTFLDAQATLTSTQCYQLYRLGQYDPDTYGVGTSMIIAVIKRPECPYALVREAATSERSSLRKIALWHAPNAL